MTARDKAFDLRKTICTRPSFLEMVFLMGENMGQRISKPEDVVSRSSRCIYPFYPKVNSLIGRGHQ